MEIDIKIRIEHCEICNGVGKSVNGDRCNSCVGSGHKIMDED